MVSVQHGNIIPVANFPDFSSEFRPTCNAFRQDAPEIIQKNSESLRSEYCIYVPAIFCVLLQNMATFRHLSWQFLRNPVLFQRVGVFCSGQWWKTTSIMEHSTRRIFHSTLRGELYGTPSTKPLLSAIKIKAFYETQFLRNLKGFRFGCKNRKPLGFGMVPFFFQCTKLQEVLLAQTTNFLPC